ncbi:MAG: metalloregulator ArsR/SmtB family transcription factor [Bryobacteraceae bacterium]|jgi:DNA-binding transcriptional ArsR family regulator
MKRRANPRTKASATLFAALGDETRLRIVLRLAQGRPASITELSAGSEITRQAVTKHLHVLEGAGLARGARLGRERRWSLDRQQVEQARAFLESISERWDNALARLKTMVEEDP